MPTRNISRRVVVLVVVLTALTVSAWFYVTQWSGMGQAPLTLSGTIEVTEINIPAVSGGLVKQVYAAEGDPVRKGQQLALIYSTSTTTASDNITAPIDGVVLERLVEPDEFAAPGSTVMVIASLNALSLKIYVPENRYGQISLGQVFPVTVDSFPGQTFSGKVTFISSQAEFTPRNVQTKDSRQTTVYAVKLALEPTRGKLKPGMPADVALQ